MTKNQTYELVAIFSLLGLGVGVFFFLRNKKESTDPLLQTRPLMPTDSIVDDIVSTSPITTNDIVEQPVSGTTNTGTAPTGTETTTPTNVVGTVDMMELAKAMQAKLGFREAQKAIGDLIGVVKESPDKYDAYVTAYYRDFAPDLIAIRKQVGDSNLIKGFTFLVNL